MILGPSLQAADRWAHAAAGPCIEVFRRGANHRNSASAATGRVVNPNLAVGCTIFAFVGTLALAGGPIVETVGGVFSAVVAVGLALVEFVPNAIERWVLPIVEDDPQFVAAALGREFDQVADRVAPGARRRVDLLASRRVVDEEVVPDVEVH